MHIRGTASTEVIAQISWPTGRACAEVVQSMALGDEGNRVAAARTSCNTERLVWAQPVRAVLRIASTATLFELETLLARDCEQAVALITNAPGREVQAISGCRGGLGR